MGCGVFFFFAWEGIYGACFQIYGEVFIFTAIHLWKSEGTFRTRVSLGSGQKTFSSVGCPTFLGRISELHLFNPHFRDKL